MEEFDIKGYIETKQRKREAKLYEYFPICEDLRKDVKETGYKLFYNFITENWDIVSKYIEWDTPENVMKHYTMANWNHLFYVLRKNNVKIERKTKQEKCEDYEGIFNTFTDEELKILCKPVIVDVVRYFKSYKKSHKGRERALAYNENSTDYDKLTFSLSLRYETAKLDLSHKKQYDKKEKEELEAKLHATKFLLSLIERPDEAPNLLDFILNHLQYASVSELTKLLEMIDKGFIKKIAGRRPNDLPVYVFDENIQMIRRYDNRSQCMEEEGLGKQYLQQLLSGKKKRKKCWYVEMTDDKYKEKEDIINKGNFMKEMY